MRKVVKSSEVPHLWANKAQSEARGGNIWFRDSTIYSYGEHFPIARFVSNDRGEEAILFTCDSYSKTTAQHIGAVRYAIPPGIPVFKVSLNSRNPNTGYVKSYQHRIAEMNKLVAGSKGARDRRRAELATLVEQANAYCEFFALPDRFAQISDAELAELQASVTAEKKVEREATKRKRAEIAAHNAEIIAKWLEGQSVRLPYSLDRVYLRVEGTEVVSSRGARFPVAHARRGLALVRRCMATGEAYHRNGHTLHLGPYAIDEIKPNGDVKAGCHVVKYSEIERIAPQIEREVAA